MSKNVKKRTWRSAFPYQTFIYKGGNMWEPDESDFGMSDRLVIATKITQGIISNSRMWKDVLKEAKRCDVSPENCAAQLAYDMADELIKLENE